MNDQNYYIANLKEFCAPGATFQEEMIELSDQVSLKVITFSPPTGFNNPPVVFVAGWISLIMGWKKVLLEMTKDFKVYYIETREKISSQTKGKLKYSAETIGQDIITITSLLGLKDRNYILLGSSLGATAILDCCKHLKRDPLCLVLIGPNAVFRVPRFWRGVVTVFYPGLYIIIKPVVKWYLRTFRLNIESDMAQFKKYCAALDTADPWKLKKAVMALWHYEVWDYLDTIKHTTLIVGASKDKLHEPENLRRMVSMMKRASYLDLETNQLTHSEGMVRELRKYIKKLGWPEH